MSKGSPRNHDDHIIPYPGSFWGWVGVAVATPFFLLLGLSFYDGWPPRDDIVGWGLVVGLTAANAVGMVLSIATWHLREYLDRPDWWTVNRQANLGKAFWLSALVGFVLIPDDMLGWDGLWHGARTWALWFVPVFIFNEVFDILTARFVRWFKAVRNRRSPNEE